MRKLFFGIALMVASCAAGSPAYADVSVSEIQTITQMASKICPRANEAAIESKDSETTLTELNNLMDSLHLTDEQKLLLLGMCIQYEKGFIDGAHYSARV